MPQIEMQMDTEISAKLSFQGSAVIASQVGVVAAIIHNKLAYHIWQNKKKQVNFVDGKFWTYITIEGLAQELPFLTPRSIRTAVDKLKENKLVFTGTFNKKGWDRTTWYSIDEYTLDTYYSHLSKSANAFDVSDNSICQNRQTNTNTITSTPPIQPQKEKLKNKKKEPFTQAEWEELRGELPRIGWDKNYHIPIIQQLTVKYGYKTVLYAVSDARLCDAYSNMDEYIEKVKKRLESPRRSYY